MKFDLMFADYDGTFGQGQTPDIESLKTVKEFVSRGGKFVVCTGRMFCSIVDICRKYGLKGPVISYQGAMINDIETGKSLRQGGVPYLEALELFTDMRNRGIQIIAELNDILFYDEESFLTESYRRVGDVVMQKIDDVIEFVKERKRPLLKVCGVTDPEIAKKLTKEYNEKYKGKLIINNGAPYLVEIVNPEFCKGSAVKFIADYYGIPLTKVITVGDSTNDIELVRGNWYGVAVGNASEELKKVAKEITVSYQDHPIKVLLKKHCLGE